MALKNAVFLVFLVLQRHLVVNKCDYWYLGTPNFMVHPMNGFLFLKNAYNNAKISVFENGYFLFSNPYTVLVMHLQEPFRMLLQWSFWYFPKKLA